MNILIGTNHLNSIGGTESFTYSLAYSLVHAGYNVDYFTFYGGMVSDKLESELNVRPMMRDTYDAILVNHNTVVEYLKDQHITDRMTQTIHGLVDIERPSPLADQYVFISKQLVKDSIEYVKDIAKQHHIYCHQIVNSKIIWNGINTDRFYPQTSLHNKLTTVLSLCQSNEANNYIKEACNNIGVTLIHRNKFTNGIFDIYNDINKADLIIGVGRSGYDAMACGRPVIAFDIRPYNPVPMGVGYINKLNVMTAMDANLTGRPNNYAFNNAFIVDQLTNEMLKYNVQDGIDLRNFAINYLNMDTNIVKYLL